MEGIMARIRRVGSLEIEEDFKFQLLEWRISRLGWAVMALIILAAILGLFGGGIFTDATLRAEGGLLEVRYERFARHAASANLVLTPGPNAMREGSARLWIDREYLNGVQVQTISPEPYSVEAYGDRLVYAFRFDQSDAPIPVSFSLHVVGLGLLQGRVGLEEGPELDFRQFVYP
jgi:hypothetical protein